MVLIGPRYLRCTQHLSDIPKVERLPFYVDADFPSDQAFLTERRVVLEMVRSILGNGRTHYGANSEWERHDPFDRQGITRQCRVRGKL